MWTSITIQCVRNLNKEENYSNKSIFRTGPNQWRDSVRPRKILYDVCKRNNLPVPELLNEHTIKIGDSVFHLEDFGLFRSSLLLNFYCLALF